MTELSKNYLRLAALTLAGLGPAAALAQAETEPVEARQFTVEVIVFRYADSVSAGSEIFVPDPVPEVVDIDEAPENDEALVFGDAATAGTEPVPIDADGNPVELDADGNPISFDADGNPIELDADGNPIIPLPPRADYLLLLEDELTMLSTWDRLDRLDAYEPLAHFGWHQQVKAFDEPIGIPFGDFGHPVPGLGGELTLYLSRFLHLAVLLELNANPNEDEADEFTAPVFSDDRFLEPLAIDSYAVPEGPTFYRIDEDRIFKSGDLRYFDHPRFGVIARIDRVEQPEDDEAADIDGAAGSASSSR